ncbi:MAG: hypothetical protein V1857_05360 [archaeon]
MRGRIIAGILLLSLGIISTGVGVYNFNEFFFTKGLSTWDKLFTTMPLYATYVTIPLMVGVLLILDGRILCRLRRRWILQIHLISNMIWLYATKVLYDLMSEPSGDPQRYQQVFYLVLATLALFLIGTLIDSIPFKKEKVA